MGNLLVADVGGTKTDLAVVSIDGGPRHPLASHRLPSRGYASLTELIRAFLSQVALEVEAACVDVAGPVGGGQAELTNLPWKVSEASLAEALGLQSVWLMNDLVATASAIPLLLPEQVRQVKEGEPTGGGPIAVLAPGTGLGEAFLVSDGGAYRACASEGGHAAFSPSSDLEVDLLRGLWRRFDHVSVERVASGVGVPNLYDFLRERPGSSGSAALAAEVEGDGDRTHAILRAALDPDRPDPLARATVELFLRILGTETANLALKVLATGGVYLAGGIAQALSHALEAGPFLEAFLRAGRFGAMLERVPVYLVVDEVALLGAASEGLRRLAARGAP